VQQITNPDLKLLGALPTLYDSRTTHSRDVLLDVADRYDPAGAGTADPADRAVRRGQRLGGVGAGQQEEQGRSRLPASWPPALLTHWKSGKALTTFTPDI